MNGGDHGYKFLHGQQTVGKTLIVVNNVVMVIFVPEEPFGPEPKGIGFRKSHGGDPDPFQYIDGITQFSQGRNPEQSLGIVQVKGRETIDLDILIQEQIRGTGHDLDLMTKVLKRSA
jgi:hypothetical protein